MTIMIISSLIIFVISIVGLTSKTSSRNRLILLSSCQTDNTGLEPIRRNSEDYFLGFARHSQSNSFSSSSRLSLSYCEQQQTTYYSSSGFAILRSSPRFLLIDNSQRTSSFHHHHHHQNASLAVVTQSLSTTPILTLMSSKENNLRPVSDYDNTTTINSFLSSSTTTTTTTTAVSNISLFHTSQRGNHRTVNITLLIGCISAGIILIIIIIYAFVKYRNRDEGSYKIDESKNFVTTPHLDHQDNGGCGGKLSSSTHHRQKLLITNGQNPVDSREWYV